jgi:putative endopeptidase
MDEAKIEALGAKPLDDEIAIINKMKSPSDLPKVLGHLHGIGVPAVFGFSSGQDFKKSENVIAITGQGGLGLPDRDFYLKNDAKSKSTREAYVAHVTNMFKLLGDDADKAAAEAQTVMKMETQLAQVSMDRVSRRDASKQYHKMAPEDLKNVISPTGGLLRTQRTTRTAPPAWKISFRVLESKTLDSTRTENSCWANP